ncbi:MAG: MmgE/PrpD family protein [Thaumarchaeota archaeon]|nr:MmgE/PrpD family protein [Nitrososphaerota archaeon]
MTVTGDLAQFAVNATLDRIPSDVQRTVKSAFLDSVGCAIAGTTTLSSKIASNWVRRNGGRSESTLFADTWKGPSSSVAFANTVSANALDFEPVGPESHVCAVTIPSALAVAEALNSTGRDFLTALVLGIEVSGKIGAALKRFDRNKYRDWPVLGHTHAVFGATVAAGKLLHLDSDQMLNAFGIAGYSATLPTLKRMFRNPPAPMTKYDNLGLLSQAGVQAAYLAKDGFTGDKSVLDGEDGFWKFSGYPECNWQALVPPKDNSWYALELWFKPYPVTSYTITALDGVMSVIHKEKIELEDIEEISIGTRPQFPGSLNKKIETSLDAWLSWPFSVSALVNNVRPLKDWQSERVYTDKKILDFMDRVKIEELSRAALSTEKPMWEGWSPAKIFIKTKKGQFEGMTYYLKRLTDLELENKFTENVQGVVGSEDCRKLLKMCKDIENLENISKLPRQFASK